jgi:hypothetical protein
VVKQKFTRKAPYGIDSGHTFEVFSHLRGPVLPESNSAVLAQLVEHITRNDEVVSSTLTNGSSKNKGLGEMLNPFFYAKLYAMQARFHSSSAASLPHSMKLRQH